MVTMQCLKIKQPTQVDLRVEVSHPLLSVDELCTQYGACILGPYMKLQMYMYVVIIIINALRP